MSDSHNVPGAIVRSEPAPVQRMHPMVAAAVSGGHVDPATMRELLAVQREWEAGEARKAFTRAKADLKRSLPTVIGKDTTVDFTSKSGIRTHYTHASLAHVMNVVTEHLTAHGFDLSWIPAITERAVTVTCRLTHSEGHHEEATLAAPADTSGNKNPAQAIASTVTLLQRYTALSLLGIATADMQEPVGEPGPDPSDAVDARANLRAVAAITSAGLRREDAERHVERPVREWTRDDLSRLRKWLDANAPPPGEPEAGS